MRVRRISTSQSTSFHSYISPPRRHTKSSKASLSFGDRVGMDDAIASSIHEILG
jgi:hypothetical protein